MPTYEYVCKSCGHRFEEFQSITAEPIKVCPKCAAVSVQRLISAGNGLIFKGSGFYITDYKNAKSVSSNNGTESGKSKSETSKSESKDTSKSKDAS